MIKYSIIIPTYNRKDLLKQCLDSIVANTDQCNIEVIVVCNGCTDGSQELVPLYGSNFKCVYYPYPVGYSKAVNLGIVLADGEYIILLNNDCTILSGAWISFLEEAFIRNSKTGLTGPSLGTWNQWMTVIFFCVMIKREVINRIGMLDPVFLIGGGEDTDFCIRAQIAGYEISSAPYNQPLPGVSEDDPTMAIGQFPLYHPWGSTRKDMKDFDEAMKHNGDILIHRWGKP